MTLVKKIGFVCLDGGRNNNSAEWKQVVAREKTKFEM